MNKAIFLDRDGVINKTIFRDGKPRAPYIMEDFALFEGVIEAIALFKDAGFKTIIVTNQPDVSRGWVSRESVEMINSKVQELLEVDSIQVCYHDKKDNCQCRKPKPGMLLQGGSEFNIDFSASYMIGDRYSDVEAGQLAGCQSILVGVGDEQGTVKDPVKKVGSLIEAAKWITQCQ